MGRLAGWWRRTSADPSNRISGGAELCATFGLSGFAITQPVLALLGDEPTWFTSRGATRWEIVMFALVVGLVGPLLAWGVGRGLRSLSRPVGRAFHLAVVAALAGLTILRLVRAVDLAAVRVGIIGSVVAGLAFAAVYAARRTIRLWTQYTAVLPLLAVASFLLVSPTSALVTDSSSSGVARASGGDEPSLLLIMLDELPTLTLLDERGAIDPVRFPNLAGLAEDGEWYPTYTTSSSFTSTAVPSILSGKPPTEDPPIYTSHRDNLFSLLAPTHDLHVFETATALCDPHACASATGGHGTGTVLRSLVADGASAYGRRLLRDEQREVFEDVEVDLQSNLDAEVRAEWHGVEQRPLVLNDLVATIGPVEEPALWFAHVMLPHQPWALYPDGSEYGRAFFDVTENTSDPWLTALQEQRLLLQMQYTDAALGTVFDALRAAGEYEDTIVAVTADHGVSLVAGTGEREVTPATTDQLAYVPLIVKGAGGRQPAADGSNVISADLLPTIASMVGVELSWEHEGFAIGSDEQRARGLDKEMYDFGLSGEPVYAGTLTFEHRPDAPSLEERMVADIEPDDDPTGGLLDRLDLGDSLGQSIDAQATGTVAASAATQSLAMLVDPPATPPGIVTVSVTGESRPDDIVLLEINGVVVTAAPFSKTGEGQSTAYVLLPPGALAASGNQVGFALRRGSQVLALDDG